MKQTFKNVLIIALTTSTFLFGQQVQPVQDGPIHEAFVTRDTENFDLDVVPVPPPAAINERIPSQTDRQSVWIPGYWSWDEKRNDYIWLSGIWRRPPPGHQWVAGTWRPMNNGWVWISGFWSKQQPGGLCFIETPPPAVVNENVTQPNGGEFFWVPGYWEYSERGRGYAWVSGHWERLDPNWILVPAHYVWYNDKYVFVPAYWDWRLEDRGTVFSPVYIPPPVRTTIVYQPVVVMEQPVIVRRLYDYRVDCFGLFFHLHRYRPDFFLSIGIEAPITPNRRVACDRGRRQPVNVRTVRQDPRNAPMVDRQNRQVPGGNRPTRR